MGKGPRLVASLALAAHLAGCSLVFIDRAPANVPPGVWVDCDETKVPPVVDAIFGAAQVIGAFGIAAAGEDGSETDEDVTRVVAPIYGLIGVAFLYSAYVGFRETNRCSRIREDAAARGVYGPQYYPPQPYPPQPYPQPQPQTYPPPQPPPPARPSPTP